MTVTRRGVVLVIELALGVMPIAIVGGFYSLLGIMFGGFSIVISLSHASIDGFLFWLCVLLLAVGGMSGILGLSFVVMISELGGSQSLRQSALAGTAAGVVTALVALTLSVRQSGPSWLVTYLLVSPIIVAGHRGYQLWTTRTADTPGDPALTL